jgi:Family of unknown function (DUF6982)
VAPSTNKKVIVARFDRDSVAGFVQTPGGFAEDSVELLTPSGSLLKIPYSEVKVVCFVREFEGEDSWREHRHFATRPKTAGLWVRLQFTDGDTVEGLIANNLMSLESTGFQIIPPDPTFQNQRIFVPRSALTNVQVLGVIGSALRRKRPAKPPSEGQLEMF